MIGITLPDLSANWTQRVDLDGTGYLLEFVWNQREGRWYFRIATEQNVTIQGTRKLVVDYDLLSTCVDSRRPPGKLVALDTSKQGLAAAYDDLGARVKLVYVEAADL